MSHLSEAGGAAHVVAFVDAAAALHLVLDDFKHHLRGDHHSSARAALTSSTHVLKSLNPDLRSEVLRWGAVQSAQASPHCLEFKGGGGLFSPTELDLEPQKRGSYWSSEVWAAGLTAGRILPS